MIHVDIPETIPGEEVRLTRTVAFLASRIVTEGSQELGGVHIPWFAGGGVECGAKSVWCFLCGARGGESLTEWGAIEHADGCPAIPISNAVADLLVYAERQLGGAEA